MRVLIPILLAASVASAADDPAAAAEKALAVFRAKGDLKELAALDDPDPWLVADELCARGEFDAAQAFARAAPRKDTEKLPEYVAAQRESPTDPAARRAAADSKEALATGDRKAALERFRSTAAGMDVTGVRLRTGIGLLLAQDDPAACGRALLDAANVAEAIGWLGRAAWILHGLGRNDDLHADSTAAREVLGRCLALEELRGNLSGTASALQNIGANHAQQDDNARALECFCRALRLFEELEDRAGMALTLANIAASQDKLGYGAESLKYFERAVTLFEELKDRAGVARALGGMGSAHHLLGQYAEAMKCLERSLQLGQAMEDRVRIAAALSEIGAVHTSVGDCTKALECQEQVLALCKGLGDDEGVARALGDIAGIHWNIGDYARALASYHAALSISERANDRSGVAWALSSIGVVHESQGSYGTALQYQERALRLHEQTGNRRGIATALNNIGVVEEARGNMAAALRLYDCAEELCNKLGDRHGVATALNNIGHVYFRLGDLPKARALHERALRLYEEMGATAGIATAVANLGDIHARRGDQPSALDAYRRALALTQEMGSRNLVASTLISMGTLLGASPEALERYREALELSEELGERRATLAALGGIARVHSQLGDYPSALVAYEQALRLAEKMGAVDDEVGNLWNLSHLHLVADRPRVALDTARLAIQKMPHLVHGLADEESASARATFADLFRTGVEAARALHSPPDASFFLESGRAGSLAEGLALRKRLEAVVLTPELMAAEADARTRERVALWHYRRALSQGADAAALWKDVESARDEVIAAVQRIQREAKAQAALLYPEADSLDTIRAALRPGEALVSYALLEKSALALLVTPGGARIVDLDAKLPEAVKAFQRAVARPDERGVAAPPHERLPFLRDRLAKLLVAPLNLDEKTTRLLISPDGLLAYVPFTALTDREVVYVPSGTTYRLLLEERGRGGEKVLAIGDPDYSVSDKTAASIYAGDEGLEALPGTRAEAQAIGNVVLLGKDATRAGFTEALGKEPRWRAVHFACHGSVDPERPVLSSLALTAEGEDDGFLKCLDVYQMRIPADLVVLSACETGKGKIYRAEGVIGFTRAFMFAGAPRVIVSLWKVDDHATRALMEKFYEAWKPGKAGAAAALRAAQEHVRSEEKWRHPYFWAAWQLWGLGD